MIPQFWSVSVSSVCSVQSGPWISLISFPGTVELERALDNVTNSFNGLRERSVKGGRRVPLRVGSSKYKNLKLKKEEGKE